METQAHMDMAHGDIHDELNKEAEEKQFLKDLHIFMKKRETPIERIPNLGFKQIDLYVMFKTVRDLGGYHQVTSQQLWKQVYNFLGGNPRSTSAATCTRRHYEKLLLPYECHVRGIMMNILPNHVSKHFHCVNFSKEDGGGQRPAKRRLLSIQQNLHNLKSDPHGNVFSMPLHYPHYYHPRQAVLPSHVPISPSVLSTQNPSAPQPWFNLQPSHLNSLTDRVKEPLEQLRSLAEQYKTSSGLAEPLNLSVKAPRPETNTNPVSSFAPPSSTKTPKFLNKPSTLYTVRCPQQQGMQNEDCDTQDAEAGSEDYSFSPKASEGCVIDVDAFDVDTIPAPSSPTYDPDVLGSPTTLAQKPISPKPESTIHSAEDREGESPEVTRLNLSHLLPNIPRENGGKMEIEIPLSVFYNWLRLCGSSAMINGANKQLPTLPSGQRNGPNTDIHPANVTFHMNPQRQPEDLRLRHSPTTHTHTPSPTTQTTSDHLSPRQDLFNSYKPLPSVGIPKDSPTRNGYPFDLSGIRKSYSPKLYALNCWDLSNDKKSQGINPAQVTIESCPLTAQRDFVGSKALYGDTIQGAKEKPEMGSSAVVMVNNGSTSLLHLTTEEVLKLKKIISNS